MTNVLSNPTIVQCPKGFQETAKRLDAALREVGYDDPEERAGMIRTACNRATMFRCDRCGVLYEDTHGTRGHVAITEDGVEILCTACALDFPNEKVPPDA